LLPLYLEPELVVLGLSIIGLITKDSRWGFANSKMGTSLFTDITKKRKRKLFWEFMRVFEASLLAEHLLSQLR